MRVWVLLASTLCLLGDLALASRSLIDPAVIQAPSRRNLFQGPGQAPFPADFKIPPATCRLPSPFSFMVSLRDADNKHTCGGALITKKWVATAAHCIDPRVTAGAIVTPKVDISGRTQDKPIESIKSVEFFPHPEFQGVETGFDLALLKLERESCLKFPIKPAPEDFNFTANGTFTFASFGRADESTGFSNVFQTGDWTWVAKDECEDDFTEPGTVLTDEMFCAKGATTAGLCAGDAGSPLVWKPVREPGRQTEPEGVLVGLGSFTDVECTDDGASFFTSIPKLAEWINKTIEENS